MLCLFMMPPTFNMPIKTMCKNKAERASPSVREREREGEEKARENAETQKEAKSEMKRKQKGTWNVRSFLKKIGQIYFR